MWIFIFSDNTANTPSSRNWAKQRSWEMEKTCTVKESGAGQVPNRVRLHTRRSSGAAQTGGRCPGCSCRWREHSKRVLVELGPEWPSWKTGGNVPLSGQPPHSHAWPPPDYHVRINCHEPTRKEHTSWLSYWKPLNIWDDLRAGSVMSEDCD